MIPVFSIYRSGNITESKANELLGALKTVSTIKQIFLYIGIVFSVLGFTWVMFSLIKLRLIIK
jgi:hypothetical protein